MAQSDRYRDAATITQPIVHPHGVVSIEIHDEDGGLVEIIPDESGVLLDTFSIARLDERGVDVMIAALAKWKACRRVL